MADYIVERRIGERRPIFGFGTVESGTHELLDGATVVVYDEFGEVVIPLVDITDVTPGPAQTVTVFADPNLDTADPGYYEAAFSFSTFGSDSLTRVFEPTVGIRLLASVTLYAGIYPWIRFALQDNVALLGDSEFDMVIESTILKLLASYDDVEYADIEDTDRKLFNEAVGLIVAARMAVPLSTGGATSPLVMQTSSTSTQQYAQIANTEFDLDERNRWERDARSAFSKISFVKEARGNKRPALFGLGGRRRAQGQPCNMVEVAFGRLGPIRVIRTGDLLVIAE